MMLPPMAAKNQIACRRFAHIPAEGARTLYQHAKIRTDGSRVRENPCTIRVFADTVKSELPELACGEGVGGGPWVLGMEPRQSGLTRQPKALSSRGGGAPRDPPPTPSQPIALFAAAFEAFAPQALRCRYFCFRRAFLFRTRGLQGCGKALEAGLGEEGG